MEKDTLGLGVGEWLLKCRDKKKIKCRDREGRQRWNQRKGEVFSRGVSHLSCIT